MDKKYTATVLVFLVVSAQANIIGSSPFFPQTSDHADKENIIGNWKSLGACSEKTISYLTSPIAYYRISCNGYQRHRLDGLGLTANVNQYVDDTIEMIVPFIQENGLDPMPLPDVEEGFEVKPVIITYSAWLRIHSGYMTGLVNVARSGDQTVNYFAKMLRMRVQLQFSNLEIIYRYLIKVMNIGPTGGVIGALDQFVVVVDLLVDFNNDEIHLQEFTLKDVGRLRVRFTGNILVDWLVNPVVNVFVRIFDNIIIRVVVSNIRSAIQDGIDAINSSVKNIISVIESHNP